ncbi:spinster family MFS transporter [Polymorphobacter sp.]|uniref:spinster family MFS transporter n=1 Tax=Polymorphobacter sp. TaxID=1909290 RepID=UPI003F72F961
MTAYSPANPGGAQALLARAANAPLRSWYAVFVLMVVYIISFIDRQVISLFVEPLKRDLLLSDTQISLLQGLSFALFYTLLGIPIGRIADTVNRRNLIIVGVGLWSLMTAACGLARSFPQLFLARMGVGVGEATLSPAAYAIIADSFPRHQLSLASSLYTLGAFLGLGLALILGGALIEVAEGFGAVQLLGAQLSSWQLVFIMLGGLGIFGIALMLTIREPARTGHVAGNVVSFRLTVAYVRAHARTFTSLCVGFSCFILMSSALAAWSPSILIRIHGFTAPQAGYSVGLSALFASGLGCMLGGLVIDRAVGRGIIDAPLRLGAVCGVGLLVMCVGLAFVTSSAMVLACLAGAYFFLAMPLGAAPAAVQMVAPATMRAQLSAFYISVINLLGLALGPTSVALFTDYVFKDEALVHLSLAATAAVFMPMAVILLSWGRSAIIITDKALGEAIRAQEGGARP